MYVMDNVFHETILTILMFLYGLLLKGATSRMAHLENLPANFFKFAIHNPS